MLIGCVVVDRRPNSITEMSENVESGEAVKVDAQAFRVHVKEELFQADPSISFPNFEHQRRFLNFHVTQGSDWPNCGERRRRKIGGGGGGAKQGV